MAQVIKTGLAVVGGVAILAYGAKQAALAIINNIEVLPGNPQLDSTLPPTSIIDPNAETYIRLDLPVTITNNNAFPLGVDWFMGVVKYGQLTLTNVNLPYGLFVPSGQTVTITLDVDVPVKRVVQDIQALIQQGNIFNALINKVTLSGSLQVTGNLTKIPIPLDNIAIPIV